MKRTLTYFTFVIVVSIAAIVTACSDVDIKGYYISSDYLKSDAEITLDGNGKSTLYKVVTNGAWSFVNLPSWVTVSPMSGNGDTDVTITTTDNPSAIEERKGQMTLRTANQERTITLVQKPAREYIESDIITLTFQPDGGTERFSIRSNTSWTLNLTGNFFSTTPTSGTGNATFTVVCDVNNDEEQRMGSLDIVTRDSVFRIPVAQLGITRTLTLSPENVEWATIKKLSGTGSDVVDVIIDENATTAERIATITFETSKKKIACQITQRAGTAPRFTSPQPTITNVGKYSATVSASYTSDFDVTEYGRNKVGVTYSTYTTFKTTGGIPNEDDVPKPNL